VSAAIGVGDTTTRNFDYPVRVSLPGPAQQLGSGPDFNCARVSDGVYCWGASGSGQVGIGDPSVSTDCTGFCKATPRAVIDGTGSPITGVVDIDVAYQAACAKKDDHTLWCWGAGIGEVATPLVIDTSPVENVSTWTTCGSGNVPQALRYLSRDDQLIRVASPITQVCP
jgi:hypothetical protein